MFQLVPQRFAAEIGVMTGLVGMAGGIGGFYLASSLGFAKQWTGSFSGGFLIFAALALVALAGLMLVKSRWRAAGARPRACGSDAFPLRRIEPMKHEVVTLAKVNTREHLIVIGNGMAGCRAVEELLARDPARYRITIFGAEPLVNYNRIMLSPVLAGEKTFDEIVINGLDWYEDNGITLVSGDPVTAIDRDARTVTAQSGMVLDYDRLLIATGSDPFIIPVPGHDLPGVISFRDMKDVEHMLAAAERAAARW